MTRIEARGLVVGEGGFRAGPIDFAAATGARVAIVGPNGCGKSTLLRTLAGFLRPRAGTLEVGGAVAFLPPPGAIGAQFSAVHLVALGRSALRRWRLGLTPSDREAAHAALDALGMSALAEHPFDRLSSGQQQLVLIARLIVQDAPICLLDEPTAMLDPGHARAIDAALARLAARDRLVVATTHAVAFARTADLVIALGNPVTVGAPAMLTPDFVEALYDRSKSSADH